MATVCEEKDTQVSNSYNLLERMDHSSRHFFALCYSGQFAEFMAGCFVISRTRGEFGRNIKGHIVNTKYLVV